MGLPTPAHYLARNFGTAFTKGTEEADSSADVATSAAVARQDMQALTGPKAAPCFKQQIGPALSADGLTVKSFSAQLVAVHVAGADASFGYNYAIDATASGHPVQIRGFEIGALVGQVEIDLTVIGTPPLSISLAQGQRLAATSVSRLKAAEQSS
jgi:hypothetical protein